MRVELANDMVPLIRQYLPLRNGITQWEGLDLPFNNTLIGNKDTYTYSVIRVEEPLLIVYRSL